MIVISLGKLVSEGSGSTVNVELLNPGTFICIYDNGRWQSSFKKLCKKIKILGNLKVNEALYRTVMVGRKEFCNYFTISLQMSNPIHIFVSSFDTEQNKKKICQR